MDKPMNLDDKKFRREMHVSDWFLFLHNVMVNVDTNAGGAEHKWVLIQQCLNWELGKSDNRNAEYAPFAQETGYGSQGTQGWQKLCIMQQPRANTANTGAIERAKSKPTRID